MSNIFQVAFREIPFFRKSVNCERFLYLYQIVLVSLLSLLTFYLILIGGDEKEPRLDDFNETKNPTMKHLTATGGTLLLITQGFLDSKLILDQNKVGFNSKFLIKENDRAQVFLKKTKQIADLMSVRSTHRDLGIES